MYGFHGEQTNSQWALVISVGRLLMSQSWNDSTNAEGVLVVEVAAAEAAGITRLLVEMLVAWPCSPVRVG